MDIKFRIWNSFTKKINDWDSVKKKFNMNIFESDLNEYIVMQYTGLKDKNGKEIYEGDIVEAYHSEYEQTDIAEVKYKDCAFSLGRYWKDGIHDWYSMEQYEQDDLKVIGNVFERKELLNT